MSRRVLVTGGSRGIGRAIVDTYRSRGFQVEAPSRTVLDLSSDESILDFIATSAPPDILINNAAINVFEQKTFQTIENIQLHFTINVLGAYRLCEWAMPTMATNGWGRVVNVSSVLARVHRRYRLAYAMSKAALEAMTRGLAVEMAHQGVLANCVSPGFVLTDLTAVNNSPAQIADIAQRVPATRLAWPQEVASTVYFLGSGDNEYISGQVLTVDGGLLSVLR